MQIDRNELPTMTGLKPHEIPRAEWERRFKVAVIAMAGLEGAAAASEIVDAELSSWPERDEHPVDGFDADWMTDLPESAAAENLSTWTE